MNLITFLQQYPNQEICLSKVMNLRYGFKPYCRKCRCRRAFRKVKGRLVYQCENSHQICPLAGTILENSTTPLQLWFYAIFIMTKTRSGISAKTLQREIGVTYKCAWRMMKQIRIAMGKDSDGILKGIVEVDESFFGGKGYNRRYIPDFNSKPKDIIMGMVERGGNVRMMKIESTSKQELTEQIQKHIDTTATVMHDQFAGYKYLHNLGYDHHAVNHGKTYVVGKTHTNNVEGLWGRIKPGIKGVYRKVSSKYIESYMDEYCFRYNNRKTPDEMFDLLLAQI